MGKGETANYGKKKKKNLQRIEFQDIGNFKRERNRKMEIQIMLNGLFGCKKKKILILFAIVSSFFYPSTTYT